MLFVFRMLSWYQNEVPLKFSVFKYSLYSGVIVFSVTLGWVSILGVSVSLSE